MIIENIEALKTWLSTCLARLCDADPAALAKYVIALVKKDKPENELRLFCMDQLEVFLSEDTKPFVDMLFETLNDGSYMQNKSAPVLTPSVSRAETEHALGECVPSISNLNCVEMTAAAPYPVSVDSNITVIAKSDKSDRKIEQDLRDSKRYSHRSRSTSKSRSRSREGVDDESRKGHYSEEERRRRPFVGKKFENKHKVFRERRALDASEREHVGRTRERCRESSRSGSRSRSQNVSCDRARSRSHSWSSRSRSNSWSRSRDRSKDQRNRSDSRNSRHKVDTPQHPADHGDTDYRVGAVQSNALQPCSSGHAAGIKNNQYSGKVMKRCQDYDEKGYCMRGDLCIYDHGVDPLIVEDVSVLNFGVPSSQVAPNSSCVLPPVILPHTNSDSPLPPPPPSTPPPPPPPPPPLPPNTYTPEPYNPEAPGMNRITREPYWTPTHPPPPHPSALNHPAGSTLLLGSVPPFNPNEPPPFHVGSKPQRARELIGVPTVSDASSFSNASVQENTVVSDSTQQTASMQESETTTISVTNTIPSIGSVPKEILQKRKTFDYSRLGPRGKQARRSGDRCTLELRKIPRNLNTITLLNNHFSKFGNIVNLQVCYDGDPEAAVVQFSNHNEATAAYRSTEAVLNNRFIKVFWHNKDGNISHISTVENSTTSNTNSCDKLATANKTVDISTNDSVRDKESAAAVAKVSTPSSVVMLPKGNLSRTIYNPAALKKTNVIDSSSSSGVFLNKFKEEQRKSAAKKFELLKRKQSVLLNYIKMHKLLFEKLTKCKNEKEKIFLYQSIEKLRLQETAMQREVRKESEEVLKLAKASSNKILTNKIETEKELLDAEMDLYNKQHKGHKGDDITELKLKILELKQKAKALGLLDGFPPRPKANLKKRSLRYPGQIRSENSARSIDHRPRKLLIKTDTNIDFEVLRKHFSEYGELESIDQSDAGVIVSFKSRKHAEKALAAGAKYGEHLLNMSWYQGSLSSSEQSCKHDQKSFDSVLGYDLEQSQIELLEEEEDEEEDSEARSWRR